MNNAPTPNLFRIINAKTAAYRMVAEDVGSIITTRGASGSVTLTLPPTANLNVGWNVRVFCAAGQTVTVASDTADTITTFNDLTADSVALSTSSEKIGGGAEFVWDGTGWLHFQMYQETQTVTVATN